MTLSYYLVEPTGRMLWTDISAAILERVRREHDVDLGRLDWRADTEKKLTPDILNAALRHGIACSRGIAVAMHIVSDLQQPDELQSMIEKNRQYAPQRRAADARTQQMMNLMPEVETGEPVAGDAGDGFVKFGEENEKALAATLRSSLQKAQATAQKLVDGPANPELEAHWDSMGGYRFD